MPSYTFKEWLDNWWAAKRESTAGMTNWGLIQKKKHLDETISNAIFRTRSYKLAKEESDEISAILDERHALGIFIPDSRQQYIVHQPTVAKRVTQTKIVRPEPEKTKKRRVRLGIGIGFWF